MSDVIPNLRGDDYEKMQSVNTKIIRRATLKIDFYLIPLLGMFCAFLTSPLLLSAHSSFRSFGIHGGWFHDHTSGGLKNIHMVVG